MPNAFPLLNSIVNEKVRYTARSFCLYGAEQGIVDVTFLSMYQSLFDWVIQLYIEKVCHLHQEGTQ